MKVRCFSLPPHSRSGLGLCRAPSSARGAGTTATWCVGSSGNTNYGPIWVATMASKTSQEQFRLYQEDLAREQDAERQR